VSARPDGFEIDFTLPVDRKIAEDASRYALNSFTYHYHHQYGSEVINNEDCDIAGIIVSDDNKKVRVVINNMRQGYIHEIKLKDFVSQEGINLLHNTAYYTLNEIPTGEKVVLQSNQKVVKHAHMAHEPTPKATPDKPKPSTTKAVMAKRVTKMPADWKQPDQVIVLATKPGLKYDLSTIQVKAGSKIKLVFNNNDDMTHNVVVVSPNAAREVGDAAYNMGLEGSKKNYIPDTNKVLYHTNLLQPQSSETIFFIAPSKAGEYTYLCTYPGHAMVMQGTMKVVN
jgi:azurin